jgi:deazaflavin-dependent oxidoreductase (nitroreductase family)
MLLMVLERESNRRLRAVGTLLYRLTRGRIAPSGRDVLLLITRGRRTGRKHTVLLQAFPEPGGMVVVAANAGQAFHPDWYLNLMATGSAEVELRDRRTRVRPQKLTTAETAAVWRRIETHAPTYRRYRNATRRTLPLVRLVPVDAT